MYRVLLSIAALAAVFSASTASAQGWLEDRGRAEGPGFRVGNLELHPGFGVEGGYDTNVFYEDGNLDPSFILRLTAHLYVSTLGAQRTSEGEGERSEQSNRTVAFQGGIAASYYHFFLDRASNNVSVSGDIDLTFNPDGVFSVRIYDTLRRRIRPFADSPDGNAPNYARLMNTAGVELRVENRGGTLSGTLAYEFDIDFFEEDVFDYLFNMQHRLRLGFNWRIFPNTALVHRTDVSFQNYLRPDEVGAIPQLSDNRRVASWVGINGAFTRTLGFTALIGYGVGFYEDSDDFSDVLVHLEMAYQPRPSMKLAIGYLRDVSTSFVGNFMQQDRIYATGQFLFGGSFLLGVKLALSFDDTGLALTVGGGELLGTQERRSDIRLLGSLFAEYRFTDWLGLNASLSYAAGFTDFDYTGPASAIYPDAPASYNKFEAWLGLRVFY